MLDDALGLLQAAHGLHAQAARSFTRAGLGPADITDQQEVLGHLALVEAYRGDLARAADHARTALTAAGAPGVPAADRYAALAMAWVHLERAEDARCAAQLDLVGHGPTRQVEPWWDTARALLEARLLVATGRPHAAVRLLTDEIAVAEPEPGWRHGVLAVARADALLAGGEPRRALAVLTPLPPSAFPEAAVVAADAHLATGDTRGAVAVLAAATGDLDGAPLTVQVRAWLLEALASAHRGHRERTGQLLARALQAAAAEDALSPLRRQWPGVRQLVNEDPVLLRTYRDLLPRLRDLEARRTAPPVPVVRQTPTGILGASLTERELEVLDLLAQMYSTEEIAVALYVSANTVKTHLKGIFAKLCVNRRAEAVRRGRQLGLC